MDSDLLRYKILKSKKSVNDIITHLDISQTTWYKKMNNKSEFTRSEIKKLVKLLSLSDKDIVQIFFN